MLVLKQAMLVYLANPKTASQAVRAMLDPFAEIPPAARKNPHMNAAAYARRWAGPVAAELGGAPETFAVMREPLSHMDSWFRYRQRDALRGHPNSTHGLTFAQFVEARLADNPPPYAALGRQDRFLGFLDGGPPVTHIFDHLRLDLMIDFLEERLGLRLTLEARNISPPQRALPELPPDLMARYRAAHATEFALYDKVSAAGHLVTRA